MYISPNCSETLMNFCLKEKQTNNTKTKAKQSMSVLYTGLQNRFSDYLRLLCWYYSRTRYKNTILKAYFLCCNLDAYIPQTIRLYAHILYKTYVIPAIKLCEFWREISVLKEVFLKGGCSKDGEGPLLRKCSDRTGSDGFKLKRGEI